jgi:hypothetical protein
MPLLESDEVPARSVMTDAMRLAIDGYQLVEEDTENTLGLAIRLVDGQRQFDNVKMFSAVDNRQGAIECDLRRPLLQAIVNFFNAGGSPDDLLEYASALVHSPQLQHEGYELAGIVEEIDREVYYITKDARVIRVVPGVTWEYVSQEELEDQDDEETTSALTGGPAEED